MPLDRTIQTKINDVVSNWVNEGRMFSAFEVSLAVKDQGVRERHRNMRDAVHEVIFRIGGPQGYSRTLMDVGAPEQAWVYHPKSTSPYRYRPLDRGDGKSTPADDPSFVAPPIRNPRALAWASTAQAMVPPGAFGTDQRGRLCLPVTLLQGLGVSAGRRVRVQCEPSQERLTIAALDDSEVQTADTTYTAEPDGNVRLTQSTLDRAGLGGLQCYRIEGDGRAITVRAFEE
jgi:hypothetical protein